MKKVKIRKASLKDAQALYDLSVEFERYNKSHSTRPHEHFFGSWESYFAEEIEESLKKRLSYVYIALVDNVPAGYIFSRLCRGCHEYIIEEFFVRAEFEHSGIGGKLLDMAIKKGRKFDRYIKVEVFDWNTSARDYYLKRGFFLESVVLKLDRSSAA